MSSTFDIGQLSGTGGLFDQVKDKLDNLTIVLYYYDAIISDVGTNYEFELGDLLINETQQIMDMIDVMTKRLENIRHGNTPCPPCHTGSTGPIGWETCP